MSKYRLLKNDMPLVLVTFLFFFSLILNSMLGFYAALTFLSCGIMLTLNNVSETISILLRYKVLFLIPIIATLSFTWSEEPIIALKGGVQLILTTIFSVIIICRVDQRLLMNCLALALLFAMVGSFLSNRIALNGMTGEYSLIGIFASKNYLATHSVMAVAVGYAICFAKYKTKYSTFLGCTLLFFSFLVLIKAKSFGATFLVLFSLSFSLLFIRYQNLNISLKLRFFINLLFILLFLIAVVTMIYLLKYNFFDNYMYSIDKDPTLTGRTYIWERGFELISSKPILGMGYQSVFVINNPVAEDIWEFAHVSSGAGFNFHNMFINLLVELGLLGFLVYVSGIVYLVSSILKINRYNSTINLLSLFMFIFLLMQSFLEATQLRQFTLVQFMICLIWISLTEIDRGMNATTRQK